MTNKIEGVYRQLLRARRENDKLHEMVGDLIHLEMYQAFKRGQDVPWQNLNDLPEGNEIVIPVLTDGFVISKKEPSENKDRLYYITEFSAESSLKRHFHSDCIEVIKVVSEGFFKVILGSAEKGNLSERFLANGDSLTIPPGMDHQVTNVHKKSAKLHITFKKVL